MEDDMSNVVKLPERKELREPEKIVLRNLLLNSRKSRVVIDR